MLDRLPLPYYKIIFQDKIRKTITESAEYKEDNLIGLPSFSWANNNGLEGLVDLIVSVVAENESLTINTSNGEKIDIKDTAEFTDFLERFKTYYQLNESVSLVETLAHLKRILQAYPASLERFMILSPVLRKIVKGNDITTQITSEDLKNLCRGFNVGVDIYPVKESNKYVLL